MRNLVQYPITREEVLEVLARSIKAHEGNFGGVDAFVLQHIQTFLDVNPRALDRIVLDCDVTK